MPTKTIRVFLHNKPWLIQEIKHVLFKKRQAWKTNNIEEKHEDLIKLRSITRKNKEDYRKKTERMFEGNNMKEAWEGPNPYKWKEKKH